MLLKNMYRDRDRERDRERKRRRSRSRDKDRDRSERKRDRRDRERDRRERDRDRGDRLEYIKTDDGGEIRIKEEPIDDYPDYSQYTTQPYDQSQIKYEEEDEKKFTIPDNTNGGRGNYDDYEEGEAY